MDHEFPALLLSDIANDRGSYFDFASIFEEAGLYLGLFII